MYRVVSFLRTKYVSSHSSSLLWRCSVGYSSISSLPVQISQQRGGLLNVVLPVLNNQKCSFPLYPNNTVYDLISDIRDESKHDSQIVLTDANGQRISHDTTLAQLISQPFTITIDSDQYKVEPFVVHTFRDNILTTKELKEITLYSYHQKIRSILAEQKRHHMPYKEYLHICETHGLTHEQASALSQALHKIGIIFHFHQSEQLKGVLFLTPDAVLSALAEATNLKFQTRDAPILRQELDKILPHYLPLNEMKILLDEKAEKRAKLWMRGGLGYLVLQFSILARMVWIDFNWDIMEPVTYFVGIFTLMGSYLFFVLYGEDYTFKALENRQRLISLRNLYLAKEFNWQKWNTLHKEVQHLKQLLGGIDIKELQQQQAGAGEDTK